MFAAHCARLNVLRHAAWVLSARPSRSIAAWRTSICKASASICNAAFTLWLAIKFNQACHVRANGFCASAAACMWRMSKCLCVVGQSANTIGCDTHSSNSTARTSPCHNAKPVRQLLAAREVANNHPVSSRMVTPKRASNAQTRRETWRSSATSAIFLIKGSCLHATT